MYPSLNRTCPIPVSLELSDAGKVSSSSSDSVSSSSDDEFSWFSCVGVLECLVVSSLFDLGPLCFCVVRAVFVVALGFRPFGLRRVSAVIAAFRRGRSAMLYVKYSESYFMRISGSFVNVVLVL